MVPSISTNTIRSWSIRAVGPGVVGAALHDRVARAHPSLGTVVEQQPGLPFEDDPDIDRLCAMHR